MGIRYSNLILATQRFLLEKHNTSKHWTNGLRGAESFPLNDSIQQTHEVVNDCTSFNYSANSSQLLTMTRINAIEWDEWNPTNVNVSENEMVSVMGQLDDYWFAMVDQMVRNQDDKYRYSHLDFEQDAYKKDDMSRKSTRKEAESVYNPAAENSLYSVLNELYQTDKGTQKTVTDSKQQSFNTIVWDSEDQSSNTQYYDRNMNKDKDVSIIDKDMYENGKEVISKIQSIVDSSIVSSVSVDDNIKYLIGF